MNRQITLAGPPPAGKPKESDFRMVESPIPSPGAGEVLVRSLYLSLDPYVPGRLAGRPDPARQFLPGEVVAGGGVGQVLVSHDPRLAPDDFVEGMLGWQEYSTAPAKSLRKIDPDAAPLPTALNALGIPGITAYFGMLEICKPQPGEGVVISCAAGPVGSLAGQIAKIKRCRVVGITSSEDKVRFLTEELGFDAAFNHNGTNDVQARLKQLCPNGIDVYFDNTGGHITGEVLRAINSRARIAVCGQGSQYDFEEPDTNGWLGQVIAKQARIEGFLVSQFASRFDEALRQLAVWLQRGKIRDCEDIVEGIENTPKAFIGMMAGENIGKRLVKIAA